MKELLFDEFFAFEKKERNEMYWNICFDNGFEGSHELNKSLLSAAISRMSIKATKVIIEIVDCLQNILS